MRTAPAHRRSSFQATEVRLYLDQCFGHFFYKIIGHRTVSIPVLRTMLARAWHGTTGRLGSAWRELNVTGLGTFSGGN